MSELPRYRCHKEVQAVKIKNIVHHFDKRASIVPDEQGILSFSVSDEYMRRHNPQIGGYYVRYADGYESFSPAEAFESGYSRL